MSTTAQPSKPKRRWYQFSLLMFLISLTAFAMWFGWSMHKAHEQRNVVAWVEKMGGTVGYDYEVRWDGNLYDGPEPPGPVWLRKILGMDFMDDVVLVDLGATPVTDLNPLAGLAQLEHLSLMDTQVSDLAPLARLTNLKCLYLYGTQTSDLTPLAGLTNLVILGVGDFVSEEEAAKLRLALPNCTIWWR